MRKLLPFLLFVIALSLGAEADAWAQRTPSEEMRGAVSVSAASPNPFQVVSRFNVTVNKAQDIKVELYNLLGQRVQEIYAGPMLAGETRTFVVEARALPAGLYVYRVETEMGVAARQVTILR